MSITAATDTPMIVIPTRNGDRRFGALTARDFARIQANYMKQEGMFPALIRWCQSMAGCIAVITEAGAKFDPLYNEDQADADMNPKKMHAVCLDILALSVEMESDEGSADPNVATAEATSTG